MALSSSGTRHHPLDASALLLDRHLERERQRLAVLLHDAVRDPCGAGLFQERDRLGLIVRQRRTSRCRPSAGREGPEMIGPGVTCRRACDHVVTSRVRAVSRQRLPTVLGRTTRNPRVVQACRSEALARRLTRLRQVNGRARSSRAPSRPAAGPTNSTCSVAARSGQGGRAPERGRLQRGVPTASCRRTQAAALSLKVPIEKESRGGQAGGARVPELPQAIGVTVRSEFKSGRPGRSRLRRATTSTSSWPPGSSTTRDISSLFHSAEIGA